MNVTSFFQSVSRGEALADGGEDHPRVKRTHGNSCRHTTIPGLSSAMHGTVRRRREQIQWNSVRLRRNLPRKWNFGYVTMFFLH